jgi:hypothetical protein
MGARTATRCHWEGETPVEPRVFACAKTIIRTSSGWTGAPSSRIGHLRNCRSCGRNRGESAFRGLHRTSRNVRFAAGDLRVHPVVASLRRRGQEPCFEPSRAPDPLADRRNMQQQGSAFNFQLIRRRGRNPNALTTKRRKHQDPRRSPPRAFVLLRGLAHWTSAGPRVRDRSRAGAGGPTRLPRAGNAGAMGAVERPRAIRSSTPPMAGAWRPMAARPMSKFAPFVSWCLRGENSSPKNNFLKGRGSMTRAARAEAPVFACAKKIIPTSSGRTGAL